MATITEFPKPHTKPVSFGNYAVDKTFTAGSDLAAGQCVTLDANGLAVTAGLGAVVIGATLYAAASGDLVDVRVQGVVAMANSDTATAIAGAKFVSIGTHGAVKLAAAGEPIVGVTLENIPGGGFGLVTISQSR